MSRLALSFLGPIQVTLDGEPVTDLRYDKLRALLSFLAVEADRPQRRDALVGLLWPDLPEEAARANLRQALASLRSAIGDRTAEPPFLLISRESIRWNPQADFWLDVAAFEALLRTCSRHAHQHSDHCKPCAQRYAQAVDLYRGDFLAQFFLPASAPFEEWAVLKREVLQRQLLEALARLVQYHERLGEYEDAERYVRRQLEIEPWHEGAHRQLMRLLVLSNKRTHALAHFERCRRILAEELGVEPDPETVALVEQIQAQTEDVAGPATHLALPAERPHNLPPQPTPFVGREQELGEIASLLDNAACRLLTLAGVGGIGKTRLALQAASAQLDAFEHGVFFVSLASVASADLLVPAIGEAIGCPFSSPESPKVQLLEFLRSKEMLLVLDNFEHLLPGAGLLAEIQAAAPAVSLLVTSRERLALQGEWLFAVHGLPYPMADVQPDSGCQNLVEQYSALHLFVQTAVRLQPRFTLKPADQPWVVRICRLVEGMPLAIELAASWVRVLSPQEIAQELERSTAFLTATLRDVAERHRSLRAVFDHSWRLLAVEEQQVFCRLAVFRGGCQRAAAEQVAGASLQLLAALVDKSLLRRSAAGRYELHEGLRQYGWERLQQAGEAEAIQDRHLAYYLDLAETAGAQLQAMQSTDWLKRLETENDNLRAALAWSLAGGSNEAGLRLAAALWLFWWMRGHTGEGRTWLAAMLDKNPTAPPLQRARALRAAGGLAYYQADLTQAECHFAAALLLFREVGDQEGISRSSGNLSIVLSEQGKYEEARAYGEESLDLARRLGNPENVANALSNLGILTYFVGEFARAIHYLEESLALDRGRGDQHDIAIRLHNLAEVVGAMGHCAEAIRLYRESLALFRQAENEYWVAYALQGQGDIHCVQGNYEQAKEILEEALALFHKLGDTQGMGLILLGFATLALKLGWMERSACLLGAVARLLAEGSATFKPPEYRRYEQIVATVESQLPAEQFAAAWEQGRQLSTEEALSQALAIEPDANRDGPA